MIRPECDISKTEIMVRLFQVPQAQRDEAWRSTFLQNVETASFACGDPQVFEGPDGFPYFVLRSPQPNTSFESFCIRNMTEDFLLKEGWGVAINPTENGVDWVFSHGDIVNLFLNKEFYSKVDNVKVKSHEVLQKEEKVVVGYPSENYLPIATRENLKKFLIAAGVRQPMMMMVSRMVKGEHISELAFNVFPENFSNREQLNGFLRQISWFLPRHYIVLAVPRNSELAGHFQEM